MTATFTAAQLRQSAYRLLGVSPNDVATFPRLSIPFKALGGKQKALEYLRATSHPAARRFIAVYDDLRWPSEVRQLLPIEAFCIAAKVSSDDLLSAIARSVREINQLAGAVKAAEAHPEVVDTSSALARAGDLDHATLNMKHMEFLPSPKGSRVNINLSANAQAQAVSQSAAITAPAPEQTIRRIHDRFNALRAQEQAALPEPRESVPMVIEQAEGELVEVDGGDGAGDQED